MSTATFIASLKNTIGERVMDTPVNRHYLSEETRSCLRRLPKIGGYKKFLENSRERKASGQAGGPEFEAHILAQAREAQKIGREAAGLMLNLMEQYSNTGVLDQIFDATVASTLDAGKVNVADLWSNFADEETRSILRDNGFSADQLAEIDHYLETTTLVMTTEGGMLQLSNGQRKVHINCGRSRGVRISKEIVMRYKPDLINRAATSFRETGRMGIGFLPAQKGRDEPKTLTIPMGDAIAGGLASLVDTLDGHVTRLEETGLKTHTGSDPTIIVSTILTIVGLVCASVGVVTLGEGDDEGWTWLGIGGYFIIGGVFFADVLAETIISAAEDLVRFGLAAVAV